MQWRTIHILDGNYLISYTFNEREYDGSLFSEYYNYDYKMQVLSHDRTEDPKAVEVFFE